MKTATFSLIIALVAFLLGLAAGSLATVVVFHALVHYLGS